MLKNDLKRYESPMREERQKHFRCGAQENTCVLFFMMTTIQNSIGVFQMHDRTHRTDAAIIF